MSPVLQSVQTVTSSVQGAAQGATASAGAPAQLADTNTTTEPVSQAQFVDETKPEDEGAAPGEHAAESVPVRTMTAGRPRPAPSGSEL